MKYEFMVLYYIIFCIQNTNFKFSVYFNNYTYAYYESAMHDEVTAYRYFRRV